MSQCDQSMIVSLVVERGAPLKGKQKSSASDVYFNQDCLYLPHISLCSLKQSPIRFVSYETQSNSYLNEITVCFPKIKPTDQHT